jgi:hypothetical protein
VGRGEEAAMVLIINAKGFIVVFKVQESTEFYNLIR